MSKSASVDLDRVTAKAWRRFRSELADRIAELGQGEVLSVEGEVAADETESGCAPYIQFSSGEADSVLGEGSQSLNPAQLEELMAQLKIIAPAVGRGL